VLLFDQVLLLLLLLSSLKAQCSSQNKIGAENSSQVSRMSRQDPFFAVFFEMTMMIVPAAGSLLPTQLNTTQPLNCSRHPPVAF
jgi:hypothetical protein